VLLGPLVAQPERSLTGNTVRRGRYRRSSPCAHAGDPSAPNFGHPWALGEHMVEPNHLPGRERRRFAGIRPEPAPPHAEDPIASPQFLPGCFVQSRGISLRVGKVLGTSLQKCIFNSKVTLLILVKSL
jgi:hypothetical protein